MVEELKLAIKVDDDSIEQSLLKQFANAQKMADKVVLDFKNVNFDDKEIEAKFKALQKKAGQNPIDLSISKDSIQMLSQISDKLGDIFKIAQGKSIIDSSSTNADISKIENKLNELVKKYENLQKKASGGISGKEVNLVDNDEFKKLSQEVSELKGQFDDLKTHMSLLDDYIVPTDRFFELQSQVETTTVKVSDLVDEFTKLSNAQKALSSTPQEPNISSGNNVEKSIPTYEQVYEILNKIAIAYDGVTKNANEAQAVVNKLGDNTYAKNFEDELLALGKGIGKETVSVPKLSLKPLSQIGDSGTTTKEIDAQDKLRTALSNTVVTYDNFENVLKTVCNILGVEIPQNADKAAKTIQQLGAQISTNDSWKNGLNESEIKAVNNALDEMRNSISTTYSKDNMITDLVDALNYIKTLNPDEFVSYIKTVSSEYQNFINSITHYRESNQQTLNGEYTETNWAFNFSNYLKSIQSVTQAEEKMVEVQKEISSTTPEKDLKDAFQGGDNQIDIKSEAKQLKKEFNDAWNEAHKINSALDETKNTIASLSQMKELSSQFGDMNTKVDSLNSELANGKITVSDYKKEVKSLTSEYSKLVNIQQNREVNDYKNQQSTINGYAKRLESYTKKESNYKATLQRFGDDGWTSDDYLEKVTAVSAAIKQYESILGNLKAHPELVTDKELSNLDKQEKIIKDNINAIQNMTAAQKGYDKLSGEKELNKISQILSENTRMSAEARAKIQAYYNQIESGNPSMSLDKIHAEILKIVNAEEQAGRTGKSMFDIFSTSRLHQIIAQAAGMFSLYDVINVGKQGLQSIRELNTALTEMRKVSDETVQSLKNYQSTTFDTADAVGTTAKQIQNSTADWMRLGESMSEAATSAKDANILLNVSEFDNIDEATESLVSMSQAYKDLDKIDIIDVLNNIGNNYSISTDGLATALKDSASALVTANNDLNEAVSLTTAGNAITQDPSKVGAGLRTISLRLVGKQYMPKHTVMYGSFTTLVSNYIG